MDIVISVGAAIAAAVVGFLLGRFGADRARREAFREGKAEADRRLRATVEALTAGRLPEGEGGVDGELRAALESRWTPRDQERQQALREALGRVGGFLRRSVREPLAGAASDAPAEELRERMERALGALEDLEFFLTEAEGEARGQNLSALVQQVTREFAQDQGVLVKLRMEGPVRAQVNAQAFMDSLYLLLHNAARFGGGQAVDVTVDSSEGAARVVVRDRGEGFSEEAFQRAFDPFYSTTEDGLGLGLPHARKTLEAMGARIELKNAPDGGAEVELTFPHS